MKLKNNYIEINHACNLCPYARAEQLNDVFIVDRQMFD